MASIIIGSRGSKLALAQSNWVADRLRGLNPDLVIGIDIIDSRPELVPGKPLAGDGIFVKEIQAALLAGDIHIGVHSMKDLPTAPVPGLTLGAVPERADPREALVGSTLADLPQGARVGTSSPRRSAQLKSLRSDLQVIPLTGNVPTRIGKVAGGECEAAMLAAAGLARLGLKADELLDLSKVLPAPGQGALAVEIRFGAPDVAELVRGLHHPPTASSVQAERGVLQGLGGGCLLPVSALGQIVDGRLRLQACVISADGGTTLWVEAWGDPTEAQLVGEEAAGNLTDLGARELLEPAV